MSTSLLLKLAPDKEKQSAISKMELRKRKKHAIIALTEPMMDANELAKEIESSTGRNSCNGSWSHPTWWSSYRI
ncbi:hypothetical protein O9993_22485 [Vibrio lentus]|nr:hypothetical protein [Vibrio lentus]